MLLAVPATAQDENDVVRAIDAAIADVEAELAGLDARVGDPGLLAFESSSRGLIEVEISEAARLAPLVRALHDAGVGRAEIDLVSDRVPGLWRAAVVLGDAPTDGSTETWLRERFGHLQDDERAALHAKQREELLAELDDLRLGREVFTAERAQREQARGEQAADETAEGERWCREHGLGETLRSEGGARTLGSPIPPLETLPEWCREPLLEWLIATQETGS
jgi:hypothetical protein